MKVIDLLKEDDIFIHEMANFIADVTDLPANIVLWTKTQPNLLPHTKYRIKVYKNRVPSASFSVGEHPALLASFRKDGNRLNGYETNEVKKVISQFSSLFISYIDGKLTEVELKEEMKKIKGYNSPW